MVLRRVDGVTAVAAGEPDPAWATSPTDVARAADVSGADGPSEPSAGPPGKAGQRSAGLSVGSGALAASGQASCPSGQTYLSQYGGCRPTSRANGRRSNGTCRACADPTHMWRNGACRPKATPASTDPTCPAGQIYYSSYRGCRPTSCTNGRTSTGTCRTCPTGQSYFSSYRGCRPTSCTNGRRSDGTCRACADQYVWSVRTGPTTPTTSAPTTTTAPTTTAPPDALTAPAKPSGLSGVGRGNSIVLSWSDPGDASITGYQYRYRIVAPNTRYDSWVNIPNSGASTTSHTVTGLAANTYYNL